MLTWLARLAPLLAAFIPVPVGAQAAAVGPGDPAVQALANPAPPGARLPRLAAVPGGGVVLSWVESASGGHALRFAVLRDGRWSPTGEVARGPRWFVNWADFPAVVPVDRRFWVAHWLVLRERGRTYDYDIAAAVSNDAGATWSTPVQPHSDTAPAEHGFVSIFPLGRAAGLVWLDGRNYVEPRGRDPANTGKSGNFELRHATVSRDGAVSPDKALDADVCTCCPTSSAVTPDGPVVAYRARRAGEIRDNHFLRGSGRTWSVPAPLGREGWAIAACPVNGPAVAAQGRDVIAAWFTGAAGEPRVRAALSRDGARSFRRPVLLDAAAPVGRVAVAWQDSRTAVAVWITAPDRDSGLSHLALRALYLRGGTGPVVPVARVSPARDVGMPQLAADGTSLLIAWTDPGPGFGVRTLIVPHIGWPR